ncbi:MAG: hypothetical protein JWO52_4091 [Gammaproteobacteria bacterium]|nr:hypothetical protein [Gammaproteobacteria bacterium]
MHTPGPWAVYNDHPTEPGIHYIRTSPALYHGEVAVIYSDEKADANARLIAAAPDLLALAHQYASECSNCGGKGVVTRQYGGDGYGDRCAALADADDQPCDECEDIRKVIDAAEGRT